MRIIRAVPALLLLAGPLGRETWAEREPKPPPLTWETFDALRDGILATQEECAFEEIPWKPTFWDAVVEAQATQRPILLWTMNGHPLGCT